MAGKNGATRQVGPDEVQLISREKTQLQTSISRRSYVETDKKKGLRFRRFFLETQWQVQQTKLLFYEVWKKHPWIRALVNKIANIAITVGWYIDYTGDGKANPIEKEHIQNFFKYPNYQESFPDILWKTIVQLKLFAESFWEMVKSDKGYPIDFYILDGSVRICVDEHGVPTSPAYIQKVFNETALFEYDEVVYFRFPDPLGKLHPSSELEALELSVLTDVYAMQLNKAVFTQGVRKGKAFIFPAETGEEQMKRNRAQIDNLHTGIIGSYSAFIALEGECTIQDLKLAEEKMEAEDLRKYLRSEMAAVIGTPLSKVGVDATDVKESEYVDKSFWQEEVQPLLDLVQNTLNRYLDYLGIYNYRFMFKKFPIRDLKETARLIDVLKKHGAISTDEVREMVGLDSLNTESSKKPFLITRNDSIIFVNEIESEKAKIDAVKKEEKASAFPFQIGRRRVARKGATLPSTEETAADEEGAAQDPFR